MLIAGMLPDEVTRTRTSVVRCWDCDRPLLLFNASTTRLGARSGCLPVAHFAIDRTWFDFAVLDFHGLTFAWLSTIGSFNLDGLLTSFLSWATF
jgi:hypothetical protein